jgi:2,3-bisphosphoglycerate-independent phosphoglycerate mutase
LTYIEHLEQSIARIGIGCIASVQGRYWAMDRDKRWERVQQAYDAMVLGQGIYCVTARQAVASAYSRGETDEFIKPSLIADDREHAHTVNAGDAVIFFNYRADRAREITRAFTQESLPELQRPAGIIPVTYVGMAQYDATFDIPVAFPPLHIDNTLGEWLSKNGVRQLRLAETEKYAHVTFFMNGMREDPYEFEDRILIPSPKVATYDLMPEMSAAQVTQTAVEKILSGEYGCLIMNYANPDMVGHTGNMEAAIIAVQVVDLGLRKVLAAILAMHGAALIVSDHGNVERMKSSIGEPYTAHTSNSVPCILVDDQRKSVRLRDGILADIAPTLLEVMGLEQPAEMDRKSLIIH